MAESAQIVEVLPRAEFAEEHIPGAVNLPLKELSRETARILRRDAPVVVYCSDYQWDLSPRAAWRLEALGFREVYDYVAGKKDWGSYGLPREGTKAERPAAGDHARRDVPTCLLTDDLGEVRSRVRDAGWDTCIVVTEEAIVLGRLGRRALNADDHRSLEDAMTEGPSTLRPSSALADVVERMREHDLTSYLITTSDGKLVGLVLRDEAETALSNFVAQSH
jgi:rhodanese-related sulfurtransferase/CBS domain-containing protein